MFMYEEMELCLCTQSARDSDHPMAVRVYQCLYYGLEKLFPTEETKKLREVAVAGPLGWVTP